MEKNQTYIIIGVVVAIILLVVIVLATRKEKKTTSTLSSGDMSKYATAVKSGDRMKSPSSQLLKTVPLTGYNNLVLSDQNGNLNSVQFPPGMIMIWAGNETSIPEGWAPCDGKNGRPDLRGKFVLGHNKNGDNDPNRFVNLYKAVGGQERVTLTLGQMPKHNHQNSSAILAGQGSGFANGNFGGSNSGIGGHIMEDKGNNESHENMPPFMVLIYIIKL